MEILRYFLILKPDVGWGNCFESRDLNEPQLAGLAPSPAT